MSPDTHQPAAIGSEAPPTRAIDRIVGLGPVRWLLPILRAYDAAGGGLLASGLAFSALFAILPAILLIVALVGVFLGDPDRLEDIATGLSSTFPPLAGLFKEALAEFAGGAVAFSVVGVLALVWGASRFYQALDDAIARIFESETRRDPIQRGLRGVGFVLLLAGVVAGVTTLSHVWAAIDVRGLLGIAIVVQLLSSAIGAGLVSICLFSAAIALVYRIVPTDQPPWRTIGRPAVAVGTFAATFTALFSLITPQLVGSLQVYGAFVVVFAAMLWLSFVCQALLIGAAWVHHRRYSANPPVR